MKEKRIKYMLVVDVGGSRPFFYNGFIIEENFERNYTLIQDDKQGTTRINMNRIISKQMCKEQEY